MSLTETCQFQGAQRELVASMVGLQAKLLKRMRPKKVAVLLIPTRVVDGKLVVSSQLTASVLLDSHEQNDCIHHGTSRVHTGRT